MSPSKFNIGDHARSKYGTEVEVLQVDLKTPDGVGFLGRILRTTGVPRSWLGSHAVFNEEIFTKIPKTVTVSTDYWSFDYIDDGKVWSTIDFIESRDNIERRHKTYKELGYHPTPIIKITRTLTYEE